MRMLRNKNTAKKEKPFSILPCQPKFEMKLQRNFQSHDQSKVASFHFRPSINLLEVKAKPINQMPVERKSNK